MVSARLRLSACVVAAAVVLTQLPGPGEVLDVLTGAVALPTSTGTPLAAVQIVLLITAGLVAWLLAAWAVVVLGIGLFARLPGRPGHRARRLLPRIAPASVGRLVLAAVGVSLIAGTAACAAPATAGPAAAGTAGTGETTAAAATSTWSTPAPTGSFAIDWPAPSLAPTSTPPVRTTPTPAPAPAPATTPGSSSAPATPSSVAPTPPAAVAAPTPNPTADTPEPTTPSPTTPESAITPSPATPDSAATQAPATPDSAATQSPATPGSAATPTADPMVAAAGGAPSFDDPSAADRSPTVNGIVVMVQPGDSLWRIAAHSLGPDATDADVDNAWRAWYFVNREVIGDDPDVILPGQDLRAPSASAQVRP